MQRYRIIVASCIAAVFFTNITAQQSDSTVLQTVVIQATRTSARSPVPHTNYSADQISKFYQAQDIPYLLSATPSLVENSDGGTGIGYTGMRIRGSDPTRINVSINGIPLNDAESQGVFWVNLPDLAASAAEIQVQRGVGTSANGAGAFGATVNLDLSKVSAEPFAIISNSLGSFGARKHSAYLGTGLLNGKIAFTGRLSQIVSDGYIDRASADLRSYHLSGTYLDEQQSLMAHVLSGHEITYQAWDGLPAQYLGIDSLRTYNATGTEKPGSPYDDEVDDYTQRHYLLHYKRLLSQGLSLQLNGHYTRGFGFYEQFKAGQSFENYGLTAPMVGDTLLQETDLIRRRWLDNHFYGGTFALRWQPLVSPPIFAGAPVFLLGGAYSQYKGKHFGELIWAEYATPKDFRYYDNDARKKDGNFFGKIELHFRKGVSTFLDLQYRQVQYAFLGFDQQLNNVEQFARLQFFNPKLGLHWAFHQDYSAYAFWGIGHREPNRDDYTQSTPGSRPRAEKLLDWEAGIKIQKPFWSATANIYFMDYRDQLVLDGRINDVGAFIRTNVPRSYRAGVELESMVQLNASFSLRGNAAFSKNKAKTFTEYRDNWDTGEQAVLVYQNPDLAFSPGLIARVEANWAVLPNNQKHQLTVSLSGKYVGSQFLDNSANPLTRLDAYFFTDLRFNYDLKGVFGQQLSLIFAINNWLDAKYASNGWVYRYTSEGFDERPYNPYTRSEGQGVYHQAGYFPQAGRQVMGTVRLDF